MKKLFLILAFLMLIASPALSSPDLISDTATDLSEGAVFQLMIDDVIQTDYHAVADSQVRLDVQDFEGLKVIKVRYGNPWPGLEDTYKWSDWSEPLTYDFPVKPAAPSGCSIGN